MNITKILQLIRPNEQWVLYGNDYSGLEWLDKTSKPTLEELKAGELALEAFAYREKRARAYPPITDQLDAYWKGGEEAEAMRAKILAVKAEFPKA